MAQEGRETRMDGAVRSVAGAVLVLVPLTAWVWGEPSERPVRDDPLCQGPSWEAVAVGRPEVLGECPVTVREMDQVVGEVLGDLGLRALPVEGVTDRLQFTASCDTGDLYGRRTTIWQVVGRWTVLVGAREAAVAFQPQAGAISAEVPEELASDMLQAVGFATHAIGTTYVAANEGCEERAGYWWRDG